MSEGLKRLKLFEKYGNVGVAVLFLCENGGGK